MTDDGPHPAVPFAFRVIEPGAGVLCEDCAYAGEVGPRVTPEEAAEYRAANGAALRCDRCERVVRPSGPNPYDPSEAAVVLATRVHRYRSGATIEDCVKVAHDPALRVRDRSFNGGYVLDWLLKRADEDSARGANPALRRAFAAFEREHDNGR